MSVAPTCRLCGGYPSPRLEMPGSPARVQTLLDPARVAEDRTVDLTLCRCERCGLVQLGEDPDLGRLYSDEYLCSVNFSGHARGYQEELARRWARDHGLGGRSVLEVGGGDGFFASLIQAEGGRVTLVDPAPRACEAARGRGIARVVEGFLGPDTLPGEVFDAVVARHVLEHAARPVEFLAGLRDRLRPGGTLFVEVPNLDGIVANRRSQDFYAEHLSYFDPRSLTAALAGAGLEVVELGRIEGGDYLVAVARVPDLTLDGLLAETGRFVGRFRELAEGSRRLGRRLAVWGAGGRCVALLTLVRAGDLGIAYVVDSDPNKWGRLLPGTHLPVVSPEALRADPVDDLVVAAVAFQGEIVGQLAWFRGEGRRLGVVQPEPRWLDDPGGPSP